MTDKNIREQIAHHIIILDGAMGTMIQQYRLTEEDFRGSEFVNHQVKLIGNNDILSLTRPDIIANIHREYLEAGADIIETNTFNAQAISQAEYLTADKVREINLTAARIARAEADRMSAITPTRPRFVAGSIGPTGKAASISPDVENPALRAIDFDTLKTAYIEQITALVDGGVDMLLIETIFDTINAKAALAATQEVFNERNIKLPIMLSITIADAAGRTLSGQTIEAFMASVAHTDIFSIGLNCSFGAVQMLPFLRQLSRISPYYVSVHPNAGLPDAMGQYVETPESMANHIKTFLDEGLVNIVGGCCGSTPAHIKAIATEVAKTEKIRTPNNGAGAWLSGLEAFDSTGAFINVGERCNVAGSRKFLRLINEKNYDEALAIARSQVTAGAMILDINMDDAMLDAQTEMVTFLNLMGSDPEVARVPWMIDSSRFEVIEAALKTVQGKAIVNSLSLKEDEELFLQRAKQVKEMGAALVVMAFDEQGQATTYERRVEICTRAYHLLTERIGFNPNDIIFDPNILTIATGIKEHDRYALDFIETVRYIHSHLPGARVSGGVSNLSFALRGNNYLREAMHSVFLYHAIKAGLDMAIVNPATAVMYEDIPTELLEALEDVILCRREDATDRLMTIAERYKSSPTIDKKECVVNRNEISLDKRLADALRQGDDSNLAADLTEAMTKYQSASAIIEGPLMSGMTEVGKLFGAGKMFLPQVVKTARTMKTAVNFLTPYIESNRNASGNAKVIIATVKGDVHDIGKNIVSVIMSCNGFEMTDLGVMVPGEEIVARAIAENADFIALSGLITPSLEEMCHVARLMEEAKLSIPLLIGGATTSALHTAVKIAPCYSGVVVFTRDAAMLPSIAQRLINPETCKECISQIKMEQEKLRQEYLAEQSAMSEDEARRYRFDYGRDTIIPVPQYPGLHNLNIPIADARRLINWRAFFVAWKLDASFATISEIAGCDHCKAQWLATIPQKQRPKATEAMQLYKEAGRVLDDIQDALGDNGLLARVALLPAGSRDEDILYSLNGETYTLPTPRQRHKNDDGQCLALADFIKPIKTNDELEDWIGLFAVTTGKKLQRVIDRYKSTGDDFNAILYQSIADRLAEAATEIMHRHVRLNLWGYATDEDDNPHNLLRQYYKGIRPAIGYPSLPDQSLVFLADKVLRYAELDISLTENGALYPTASTTGYIIAHPQSRYFTIK